MIMFYMSIYRYVAQQLSFFSTLVPSFLLTPFNYTVSFSLFLSLSLSLDTHFCCAAEMKKSSSTPEKLDRKTVERNRRIHMKALCVKLTSLIPPNHFKPSKEILSQHDQLDQAATYIKQLKERIEELQSMKALAMSSNNTNNETTNTTTYDFKLPVFELKDLGSSLEVLLISGLKRSFKLYEVISVLQDEGADVVTASYATVGDKVFHTIHAQVKVSRVGVETSRICQRLQELIIC